MTSILSFFRNKNNLPLTVVPLLLLIWAGFIAPPLGLASYNSVDAFVSPYRAPLALGASASNKPLANRVILVIVDGLRVDASRQMATLNRIRAQGADRVLTVGQPSLSLPGATVIGTGGWQEQTGVTSNSYKGAVPLDSIFTEAKRSGLSTYVVGGSGWGKLFPGTIEILTDAPDPGDMETNVESIRTYEQGMFERALAAVKTKPGLLLVHFSATDNAGHGWGGTSKQYTDAAQIVDANLAKLLAAVDLNETAFIVTADHGHIDSGGHAGWEPSVLRVPFAAKGKGIKPGQYPDAYQTDIAPTIAALLGLAIPAHNQGRVLRDQLDGPGALVAARAVDNAAEVVVKYDSMLQAIGSAARVDRQDLQKGQAMLQTGDYAGAQDAAERAMAASYAAWQAAVDARVNGERLLRLGVSLLILVPFALYLFWWRRARWNWAVPVIAAVVYFALWNINYFLVQRLTYSLSSFNSEAQIETFLTTRVLETMAVLVIAMVVVGLLSLRERMGEVIRRAVNAMFLVGAALAVQILIFYTMWGVVFDWHLPDLFWGFKYYLDLFQTTGFYPLSYLPMAALLPFIAAGVARLARAALRFMPGSIEGKRASA